MTGVELSTDATLVAEDKRLQKLHLPSLFAVHTAVPFAAILFLFRVGKKTHAQESLQRP